jgi:hypothetical protein
MMRLGSVLATFAIGIGACAHSSAPVSASQPAPTATAAPRGATPQQRELFIRDSFSPQRGHDALVAFRPAVAATESGGECRITRTAGSGATIVGAAFPTQKSPTMNVVLTFDSAGHLVRYSEGRGAPHIVPPPGSTRAQADSVLRETLARVRRTSITLEWPIDHGVVINSGGGQPSEGVTGTVRDIESLPQLGPPSDRLERVRRLCGV